MKELTVTDVSVSQKKFAVLRLLVLVAIVGSLLIGGLIVGPARIESLFEQLSSSPWGAVAFILLYAVLTMLMAPGAVSSIAGGAIFGLAFGFALTMVGATLGAVGAFVVARKAGQESVRALLGDKAQALDGWIDDNGLSAILLLRLLPIVPFNVLNYAAGLSPLDVRRYTIGTAVGIIPGVAVFTNIGANAKDPGGPQFILSLVALALLVLVSSVGAKRVKARRERAGIEPTSA